MVGDEQMIHRVARPSSRAFKDGPRVGMIAPRAYGSRAPPRVRKPHTVPAGLVVCGRLQVERREKNRQMNCYLCAQELRDSTAVAVCPHCGAALCLWHVRMEESTLVRGGMYMTCSHDTWAPRGSRQRVRERATTEVERPSEGRRPPSRPGDSRRGQRSTRADHRGHLDRDPSWANINFGEDPFCASIVALVRISAHL